jgi:hypothetical protein
VAREGQGLFGLRQGITPGLLNGHIALAERNDKVKCSQGRGVVQWALPGSTNVVGICDSCMGRLENGVK